MDWMSEKIDLSEFDLDSLIGSCSSDDSPSSPEDFLASLDSHMDLDLETFDTTTIPTPTDGLELGLSLADIPPLPLELPPPPPPPPSPPSPPPTEATKTETAPDDEVVDMKSEPPSPASPQAYTLDLGSEVDVSQTAAPIVLSIPTILVVLTNKDEPPLVSLPDPSIKTSPPSSDCEDDSGIESVASSPPRVPSPPPTPSPAAAGSSRTKPYSKPEPNATSSSSSSSPSAKAPKVKSVSGAPKVVEKKLKKMEQNKTAATRYRQKKRVEQDHLNTECDELEKRNHELAEKAESISREIQYLKDLMEEVRKHHRGKTGPVA